MAAYRQVDGLKSPAGWLPVHWDQLQAQRSETSVWENFTFTFYSCNMLQWYSRRNADEVFDDFPIIRLSNMTWTWTFRECDHVTEAFRFTACTHTAVVL